MKLPILGGTLFLGRHLVEAALARGHEPTLFNRGRTNPGLFPDVETLRGDRDAGDLAALRGRRWDAVAPFTEMPLWLPSGWEGLLAMDVSRALGAGLTCRPLEETARATLAWDGGRAPEERQPKDLEPGVRMRAGMEPEREAALLAEWRRRSAS